MLFETSRLFKKIKHQPQLRLLIAIASLIVSKIIESANCVFVDNKDEVIDNHFS